MIVSNKLIHSSEKDVRDKAYASVKEVTKQYQIGIVTALPKEFAAVRAMMDDLKEYPVQGDPNTYWVGTIPSLPSGGCSKNHIVVTSLPKIGTNIAASVSTNLLRSFLNVRDVLMVGIAGGIPNPKDPEKHTRLGDIVVPRDGRIMQCDMRKIEAGHVEIRDATTTPSARMISRVNLLETKRLEGEHPWEHHIERAYNLEGATRPEEETDVLHDPQNPNKVIKHPKDPTRRKGQPKIHYGSIGSTNVLLKDPCYRDQLKEKYGILAIEMESSGIADSTWMHGVHCMVIRGISDYCDKYKNDLWQTHAAIAAAAYTRALLELLPSNL